MNMLKLNFVLLLSVIFSLNFVQAEKFFTPDVQGQIISLGDPWIRKWKYE